MSFLKRRALKNFLSPIQSTRVILVPRLCRTVVIRHPRTFRANASFKDAPKLFFQEGTSDKIDWLKSFQGISSEPFSKEIADILQSPMAPEDVKIYPEGLVFLPEANYIRILNQAFGPEGWSLIPRGEPIYLDLVVTQEFGLICHGRLVSIARGEMKFSSPTDMTAATSECKSGALVRCCKDLGIASELWDPRWTEAFKKQYCEQILIENMKTGKRRPIWTRLGAEVEDSYKKIFSTRSKGNSVVRKVASQARTVGEMESKLEGS